MESFVIEWNRNFSMTKINFNFKNQLQFQKSNIKSKGKCFQLNFIEKTKSILKLKFSN